MKKITIESFISDVTLLVNQKRYDSALEVYVSIHKQYPDFLQPSQRTLLTNARKTHIQNAANLARRLLFEQTYSLGCTARLKEAIAMFCGGKPKQFANENQKPNFFYIPNLPSSPFLNVNEVEGLNEWITAISKHKPSLLQLCTNPQENYVDTVGGVPDTVDWNILRAKWKSLHLKKAGEWTSESKSLPESIKSLLNNDFIAHCPPHAPEVVISVLQPQTKIPLHFGISNIKWTLHIPLEVTSEASLYVSDITRHWETETTSLLFDDSYVHGAVNNADVARSVLIIDIWNPALSQPERADIQTLMQIHSDWTSNYGVLARIDSRFYL